MKKVGVHWITAAILFFMVVCQQMTLSKPALADSQVEAATSHVSDVIQYIGSDHKKRNAWLLPTDVTFPRIPGLQQTVDPDWKVEEVDNNGKATGIPVQFQTIYVLDQNGKQYGIKMHSSFGGSGCNAPASGNVIFSWFEFIPQPNPAPCETMIFLDWDSHPWKAQVLPAKPKTQPHFKLTPL